MVISYIYSTCWSMKSIFYECQQPQPEEDAVHIQGDCNDLSDYTPLSDLDDSDSVLEPVQEATEFHSYGEESPMVLALLCGLLSQMGIKRAPEYRVKGVPRPRQEVVSKHACPTPRVTCAAAVAKVAWQALTS
jgi:hypothetical protein